MFFKKHPNVTDDYFHAYWANNHVEPLLKLTKFGDKVRRYNQHHITPELRAQAKAMGMPMMDFDGVSEVWVDSMEDWISIVKDPEFREVGAADAGHFITSPATIMLGYDHLIIGE
ncbi:hypothetical protein Daus18300_012353 [Diaporthe australafricana]|uniref:EthD domain-containing protein n=1 Tax=Diaporthe australafricana TaxID=127596 RepID=A0ABR3W316_9PEZI